MLLDIEEQIFCKPIWKAFVNLFETHDLFGSERGNFGESASVHVVLFGGNGHLTRKCQLEKLSLKSIDLALKLRYCNTVSFVFSCGSLR